MIEEKFSLEFCWKSWVPGLGKSGIRFVFLGGLKYLGRIGCWSEYRVYRNAGSEFVLES